MWITADLFPEDLAAISATRAAAIETPGGEEVEAAVDSSLPRVEAADRVARLRLVASNPGHKLLPGMTITVRLPRTLGRGLTVPAESVIETGIHPRVFVERSDGSFEARPVTTGWQSAGRTQIVSGLQPGEKVVVDGAFLIDSESRFSEALK